MKCRISRLLLDRIADRARLSPGREVCGLLLGSEDEITEAVPIPNAAADPSTSFVLEGAAHVMTSRRARERGLRIIGHYHSHTRGNPSPSPADAALRSAQGTYWMILTSEEQRLWVSRSGGAVANAFDPVMLEIDHARPCNRWVQGPIGSARVSKVRATSA